MDTAKIDQFNALTTTKSEENITTDYFSDQAIPSPLSSEQWKMAYRRASHYLYLNQIPVDKQTEILEKVVNKAMQKWHIISDQDKLVSFFIEEVQQYLYPETSTFYQINNHVAPDSHQHMGYLRASTGPNIRRSSIRPAVLEKIPVSKLPVYLSRYKTH